MSRGLKRVPLDFDWPLEQTWEGYISPDKFHEQECIACMGTGYSAGAQFYYNLWYGKGPFIPADPLSRYTPEVRARAERNIADASWYYGSGEAAIAREADRLAALFNGMLCHHLEQSDVDALVVAGRLMDFTHTWDPVNRWKPKDPVPKITAEEVNRWSLRGMGHDSINCHIVIEARCKREGIATTCPVCEGRGSVEKYPGQRAEGEAWEPTEPPVGDGWQVWESISEGSPVTPVFATAQELIQHMTTVGIWDHVWNRADAEKFVNELGWAPSVIIKGDGTRADI